MSAKFWMLMMVVLSFLVVLCMVFSGMKFPHEPISRPAAACILAASACAFGVLFVIVWRNSP